MKVIELLNKIANGEEVPKKIEYNTLLWNYCNDVGDYSDTEWYLFKDIMTEVDNNVEFLNNEVEIIEENKKISKLDLYESNGNGTFVISKNDEKIQNKINEIIDKLNELKENNND